MYAIGVGFMGKWAFSPNKLVFWASSLFCPITMIAKLNARYKTCPTLIVYAIGVGFIGK